ncbi:MAG: hypothetical protein ACREB9_02230 [Thermoplasmata archaeon]
MPSRKLHAELNDLMGVDRRIGRQVQSLMDAGSQHLGGRHRELDPLHTASGAISELARRGELNAESARAVLAHLAQDRLGDLLVRANPVRGVFRPVSKQLVEKAISDGIRAMRRRR